MEINVISKIKHIKKKSYAKEYKHKIESFAMEHGYNFFDYEVILYAIGVKDDIISSFKKTPSAIDQNKIGYIKWIENYIDEAHEYLIEQKMKVPALIKKQKNYVFTSNKDLVARHLGKRNILSRRKWIWMRNKYYYFKKKKVAHTTKEYARLIRSELFKNKPEFWEGNIYNTKTISEILERQNW